MAYILSENAQNILKYLQAHRGENLTAKVIAAALDLKPATVNGTLTAMQRKGLTIRVEQEEGDKLIQLTSEGVSFNPLTEKPVE